MAGLDDLPQRLPVPGPPPPLMWGPGEMPAMCLSQPEELYSRTAEFGEESGDLTTARSGFNDSAGVTIPGSQRIVVTGRSGLLPDSAIVVARRSAYLAHEPEIAVHIGLRRVSRAARAFELSLFPAANAAPESDRAPASITDPKIFFIIVLPHFRASPAHTENISRLSA
jgi:hypothetical protein